jgi:prepilin-type processing-associated H-X9-DG protein
MGPQCFTSLCTYQPYQWSNCPIPGSVTAPPGIGPSSEGGTTDNPAEIQGCFNEAGARIRFGDIKDGMTNTIMVGEHLPVEKDFATYDGGLYYQCRYPALAHEGQPVGRQHWACFRGGASHGITTTPINHRTNLRIDCNYTVTTQEDAFHSYNNWGVAEGFKSRHPGGANFLFADGSVHFLSEDINHTVYQYLGCRKDGKHIEEIP